MRRISGMSGNGGVTVIRLTGRPTVSGMPSTNAGTDSVSENETHWERANAMSRIFGIVNAYGAGKFLRLQRALMTHRAKPVQFEKRGRACNGNSEYQHGFLLE
jgi:hypothetical protein